MRWTPLTALFLLATAAAQEDGPVRNAGFEDELASWTTTVDTEDFGHSVTVDLAQQHGGRGSLKLSSPVRTFVAKSAVQRLEPRPGGMYKLVAWCRTQQLQRDVAQAQDAYVSLAFLDRFDRVIAEEKRRPRVPDADWHTLGVAGRAPEKCRAVEIRIVSSKSGSMWVDDVALFVTGGRTPQKTQVLLSEDFAGATAIPPRWTVQQGARNAGRGGSSTVTLDEDVGAPSNYNSIRLEGDASCAKWMMIGTDVAVEPGDQLTLTAMVKAEGVRREGNQYDNLHLNVGFFDDGGERLAFFTQPCGRGTFNWRAVELKSVAPRDTTRAHVGFFLSMTGKAWVDRIELVRTGNTGTTEEWPQVATHHLDVKYSPEHPRAGGMRRYAQRLERAYVSIRKALDVRYDERITVMLYRDDHQGMELTGRRLNFAEPEERVVHMRPNATPGHEMVHVIAQAIGPAGTALLGEGIAVWLDTQGGEFHHARAAALLEQDRVPTLDVLLNDFRSDEKVTYRVAGSFVGYLIETHGLDAFKSVYVLRNPRFEAEPHLGVHLEVAFRRWQDFLRKRSD